MTFVLRGLRPYSLLVFACVPQARRLWETHHANLEMRDEEFLRRYKRNARMSGVQITMAKVWRGFVFRRKFLAWKGRRQWSLKVRAVHSTRVCMLLYCCPITYVCMVYFPACRVEDKSYCSFFLPSLSLPRQVSHALRSLVSLMFRVVHARDGSSVSFKICHTPGKATVPLFHGHSHARHTRTKSNEEVRRDTAI